MSDQPKRPPRRLTKAKYAAAIRARRGLMTAVADHLDVDRGTVYRALKRWPDLNAVLEEARERTGDVAEAALFRAISQGDAWAIQFYLKTQGRKRGYGDRLEVQHGGRLDLANLTDEELRAIRDGAAGGRSEPGDGD